MMQASACIAHLPAGEATQVQEGGTLLWAQGSAGKPAGQLTAPLAWRLAYTLSMSLLAVQ
jgi:hypothetical protein